MPTYGWLGLVVGQHTHIEKYSDINVNDVAFLQQPGIRNAVTDDLVDAGAHRLGKLSCASPKHTLHPHPTSNSDTSTTDTTCGQSFVAPS